MVVVGGCEIGIVLDVVWVNDVYYAECYTWENEGKVIWSQGVGESEVVAVGEAITGMGDYQDSRDRHLNRVFK